MTTKKQEREALEQIKNILATLDPDGWVNIAFEGVIEDAEENIENDFALSMNGRWQDAEQKLERLKAENEKYRKELEAANERIENLKKASLSKKDMDCALYSIGFRKEWYQSKADEAAQDIVKYADDPDSEDFRSAVKTNRFHADLARRWDEVEARVSAASIYAE